MTPFIRSLFMAGIFVLLLAFQSSAAGKDSMAYNLATLQVRNANPESVMMHKKIEPPQSVISEFEWLLQSIQNHSTDDQPAIANSIIETWYITNKKGAKLSLLDIARALSQLIQNTNLFGKEKIPSQLVAKYWLAKYFLPTLKK